MNESLPDEAIRVEFCRVLRMPDVASWHVILGRVTTMCLHVDELRDKISEQREKIANFVAERQFD